MTAEIGGQRPNINQRGEIVNILKSAAVIAASLVALAACQSAVQDTTADEAAIAATAPAWAAAFNAGDADALTAMYWDDAVVQPPGVPSATGTAAIRELLAGDIAAVQSAGLTMHIPESGAVDVSGDLGYEAGTYSVTDASGATVDTGKYLGVLQKRDGQWRYVRDTWNSDMAPAPAAPASVAAAQ